MTQNHFSKQLKNHSMEYSNEFLARVYGAYMGCEYTENRGLPNRFIDGAALNNMQYQSCYEDNKRQIILTPIDRISDEDAIRIAMMQVNLSIPFRKVERMKGVVQVYDLICENSLEIFFAEKLIKIEYEDGKFHTENIGLPVWDYLRSKGYDCGYGDIPSLIEAGLAIDKTKLNN